MRWSCVDVEFARAWAKKNVALMMDAVLQMALELCWGAGGVWRTMFYDSGFITTVR